MLRSFFYAHGYVTIVNNVRGARDRRVGRRLAERGGSDVTQFPVDGMTIRCTREADVAWRLGGVSDADSQISKHLRGRVSNTTSSFDSTRRRHRFKVRGWILPAVRVRRSDAQTLGWQIRQKAS